VPFKFSSLPKFAICLLLLTGLNKGEPRSPVKVGAPVLGFVFDREAAGLRPIVGVPGAATIAAPLDLGITISFAVVSPQQDFALALAGEDNHIVGLGLGPAGIVVRSITGLSPQADKIAFGPAGKSAALFYSAERRIAILTGLPNSPNVVSNIDVSTLAGTLTALAVRDDGATVLVGLSEGETGSLFRIDRDGNPLLLSILRYPSAIQFLHKGKDAIVADREDNKIYRIVDVPGNAQVIFMASEREEISTPIDFGVSADDSHVLIANSGTGITVLPLPGGAPESYSIEGGPSGLHRLRGNSVFLLTEPSQDPLLIFDGDSARPRIVIVPQ
jgi:hypothetical protein